MSSTLPRREPRLTGSPPVSGRAEKAYTVDCAAAESRAAHILVAMGDGRDWLKMSCSEPTILGKQGSKRSQGPHYRTEKMHTGSSYMKNHRTHMNTNKYRISSFCKESAFVTRPWMRPTAQTCEVRGMILLISQVHTVAVGLSNKQVCVFTYGIPRPDSRLVFNSVVLHWYKERP